MLTQHQFLLVFVDFFNINLTLRIKVVKVTNHGIDLMFKKVYKFD